MCLCGIFRKDFSPFFNILGQTHIMCIHHLTLVNATYTMNPHQKYLKIDRFHKDINLFPRNNNKVFNSNENIKIDNKRNPSFLVRTFKPVWVRNTRGRLVRIKGTITKSTMDPTGDNSDLRVVVEQQGERIGQLTSAVELLVKQLSRMNLP